MKRLLLLFAVMFITNAAQADIFTREVYYKSGDLQMKGYIAYDKKIKGKRPGIIVVHEWWGHNNYARKRARMLAELGYVGFAIDMYGEGKNTEHPKEASAFSKAVKSNIPEAEKRFLAAKSYLDKHAKVQSLDIAAIGYCFGGGIVLEMARRGMDLKGVASFHGSLKTATPARKGVIKASILVANGADDPLVKEKDIFMFHKEMSQAEVNYQVINYLGAKHAFTNPAADGFGQRFNIPLAYNKEADEASWSELKRFLKSLFL